MTNNIKHILRKKVNFFLWSSGNCSLYSRLSKMTWTKLMTIKINHQHGMVLNPNTNKTRFCSVSFKRFLYLSCWYKAKHPYKFTSYVKSGLWTNKTTHMKGTPVTRMPCKCAECHHQFLDIYFCHWANRQRNVYNYRNILLVFISKLTE